MTVQKLVLEIAATRKSSVKDLFREAYSNYYAATIPEKELVEDCIAFNRHRMVPEYVEDYVLVVYGFL